MNIKKLLKEESKELLPDNDRNNEIKKNLNILKEPQETYVRTKQSSFNWKKFSIAFASLSVCLIICVAIVGIVFMPSNTNVPVSNTYISININPSFSIETDKDDNVVSVKARNKDAAIVLYGLKFEGKTLENVCDEIIENSAKLGYISHNKNINILAVNNNEEKENEVSNLLTTYISNYISTNNIDSSVVDVRASVDSNKAKNKKVTKGKLAMMTYANNMNISNAFDLELANLAKALDNMSEAEIKAVNKELEDKYELIEDGIDEKLDNIEVLIDKAEDYIDSIEDIIDHVDKLISNDIKNAITYYNDEIDKLSIIDERFVVNKYIGESNEDTFESFIDNELNRLKNSYKDIENEFKNLEEAYENKLDNIKNQIKNDEDDEDLDDDENDENEIEDD